MFLRIIQHLSPNGRAFRTTIDKALRQYLDALGQALGDDLKSYYDLIWLDIFAAYTRELDQWEGQWALPNTTMTEQERRDRLAATWKALGGQSPRYVQDTLQGAGFDVYVHEWWTLPLTSPAVARNPNLYLRSISVTDQFIPNCGAQKANCGFPQAVCGAKILNTPTLQYIPNCGAQKANCGFSEAVCGASNQPTGFPLVNKLLVPTNRLLTCGSIEMNCGNSQAVCGGTKTSYSEKQFTIPADSTLWPYFIYIGGQTFPNHATVPGSRRNEFETLCLKLNPNQLWLGMLIDYA